MTAPEKRQDKLQRLATRICAGEVVFFIGAGFSLDSEGNSTKLLIARLLARFEAMAGRLQESRDPETAKTARRLREGLRVTFALDENPAPGSLVDIFDASKRADGRPSLLDATLTSLAPNYYLINDWMCSAFDALLVSLERDEARDRPDGTRETMLDFEHAVRTSEDALLQRYAAGATLDELKVSWYIRLLQHVAAAKSGPAWERAVAGKALFLDTLGFNNDQVMAGQPLNPDLEQVAANATRLRLRHRVLAWLAAEGLGAAVVTTNYDLLLDSAYRLAGLQPLRPDSRLWMDPEDPLARAMRLRLPLNRRYRHFTRIAQATQFFSHGEAHESALIHKIHGCVETYRLARDSDDLEEVRKILPSIVFTFREIQNWREDSWSRDHLATLMRTRTIVFAGYSAVDQVIHDTFRTVYEEVGEYRAQAAEEHHPTATDPTHKDGRRARAFFTDRAGVNSFHGLEILRAASKAAGDPTPDLTDHVNLLTFFTDAQFPTLDETFTWIYHLTARELQAQALESEVGRIGYQLFDRRCPDEEIQGLVQAFARLRAHEAAHSRRFDVGPTKAAGAAPLAAVDKAADAARIAEARRWFAQMTRWTSVFSVALMREYQLGESLLRFPTDSFRIHDAARYPWYRPLTETPQWTAWGAILELAIRRAASSFMGRPAAWLRPTDDIDVVEATSPTIMYRAAPLHGRRCASPPVRRALTIKLSTFWRRFTLDDPNRLFAARTPVVWELQPHTVPWWTQGDRGRPVGTPAARVIWQWAAFAPDTWAPDADPGLFFEDALGGQQQQPA